MESRAAFVVAGFFEGRAGMADLAGRIGRWRFSLKWWLVVTAVVMVAAAILDLADVIAGRRSRGPVLGSVK